MAKEDTWSTPAGVSGLIGRKELDLSLFEYGTTIPMDYREGFLGDKGSDSFQDGERRSATLVLEGKTFDVKVVKWKERDLVQLRYESNRDLKRIIKERFQESYEYLLAEKQRLIELTGKQKVSPRLPATRKEYIDFHENDKPYQFRIEFITNQDASAEISLVPGNILDYGSVIRHFGCTNEGKIRTTNSNSLVLIADHTNSWYEDYWDEDGVFHFVSDENEVITETMNDTISMFLFEIYETGRYLFKGRVHLAASPYQEEQPDEYGVLQNVRIYPMKLADEHQEVEALGASAYQLQQFRERRSRSMPNQELANRAKNAPRKTVMTTTTTTYRRDPYVTEYAKRWARGICQLCDEPAPFIDKDGHPYLETHHVKWLSHGGEDTVENTVALCPNCHRKMHWLNAPRDVEKLLRKIRGNVNTLSF